MKTASIVIVFDECLDALDEMFQVPVVVRVDLFLLQRFYEAFAVRVVIRETRPTDAWNHSMAPKHLNVNVHNRIGPLDPNDERVPEAVVDWQSPFLGHQAKA